MGCSDAGSDVAEAPKQYGLTKPISLAGPTQEDLRRTVELEKFLADAGLYGRKEEAIRKEEVLGLLDQIEQDTCGMMLQCHPHPMRLTHWDTVDIHQEF